MPNDVTVNELTSTWLTTPEAAQAIGVSLDTVRRWLRTERWREEKFPNAMNVGGQWFVSPQDVEAARVAQAAKGGGDD
jgi:excisionase family DNA binding protein